MAVQRDAGPMMGPGHGGASSDLNGDELRTVLSNRYRRFALRSLADADAELHLADLAHDVVRQARSAGGGSTPEADVGSVYVQLYHNHVPRLRDAGLVAFDAETKLVSPTPATGRVAAALPGGPDR